MIPICIDDEQGRRSWKRFVPALPRNGDRITVCQIEFEVESVHFGSAFDFNDRPDLEVRVVVRAV